METLTAQDLVSLGTLLRQQKFMTAYRFVERFEVTAANIDIVNGVSKQYGVEYKPQAHKPKYWQAVYNR